MTRAILIGDGQLELFRDLKLLTHYVEHQDAETGKYHAYTEDSRRWKLLVECEFDKDPKFGKPISYTVAKEDQQGEHIKQELLRIALDFFDRCGLDLPRMHADKIFDVVEDQFGFKA